MKTKRKAVSLDLDILAPLLISQWRKLHKIAGGPPDVLQTREFRGVVAAVKKLLEGLESGDRLIGQDYFQEKDLGSLYSLSMDPTLSTGHFSHSRN